MRANTTSVVIIDTEAHALARRALETTLTNFPADEVAVFSDEPAHWEGYPVHRVEKIRAISDYNKIILMDLPQRLRTDFALVVQFDGFAINADRFDQQFYEIDYIGAPWAAGLIPGREATVGNGGFSLRSRRLIECVAARAGQLDFDQPEDNAICLGLREQLEAEDGMVFATVDMARRFSVESDRSVPVTPFGFHGLHLLPLFYRDDYQFLIDHLPRRCLRLGSYQLSNLRLGFSQIGQAASAALEAAVATVS